MIDSSNLSKFLEEPGYAAEPSGAYLSFCIVPPPELSIPAVNFVLYGSPRLKKPGVAGKGWALLVCGADHPDVYPPRWFK
jgi:hypothetical protein